VTRKAPPDGRDQRDLVAVPQLALAVGVLAVDRVEQTAGLLAQPERGPDVGDGRSLELSLRPARPLAQAREKAYADHRVRVLDKVWRIRHRYGGTALS